MALINSNKRKNRIGQEPTHKSKPRFRTKPKKSISEKAVAKNDQSRQQKSIFGPSKNQTRKSSINDREESSPTAESLSKEENTCFKYIVEGANNALDMAFFFKLSKAMHLKAVIGTMVSLTNTNLKTLTTQINFAAGILILFFYPCLALLATYLVYYKHRTIHYPWDYKPDAISEDLINKFELFSDLNALIVQKADKKARKGL